MRNKKAQEEMVGFVMIIIIVAVILLIFLGISLRSPNKDHADSYKANSFVQAYLQYTTTCSVREPEYLSIQDLISECIKGETCSNQEKACDILNETSEKILTKSWIVEQGSLIQGYNLRIISNEEEILVIEKGNSTNNYQSGSQEYIKSGKIIQIFFNAYY